MYTFVRCFRPDAVGTVSFGNILQGAIQRLQRSVPYGELYDPNVHGNLFRTVRTENTDEASCTRNTRLT